MLSYTAQKKRRAGAMAEENQKQKAHEREHAQDLSRFTDLVVSLSLRCDEAKQAGPKDTKKPAPART